MPTHRDVSGNADAGRIEEGAKNQAVQPAVHSPVQPMDVAVGILIKPNGDVLLAQRPEGKPYAGYWEFPGGKVEQGEPIWSALRRELMEELGIDLLDGQAWCGVAHRYPHADVRLHFYVCRTWQGEPEGLEGQALAWQGAVSVDPVLPATIPLLAALESLRYSAF